MAEAASACYIGIMFEPRYSYGELRRRRFRPIPVRMLVPNVITLLAICAGLTAIRLSTEGRMELAVAAIVFAAVLDGIDGRVARMIKGQSKFGAELDSLADFVNFGVAPGLILYFWDLHELKSAGWIAAMVFAICAGLRLARFNVMIDDPSRPVWAGNFFTGMPAPAGAITVDRVAEQQAPPVIARGGCCPSTPVFSTEMRRAQRPRGTPPRRSFPMPSRRIGYPRPRGQPERPSGFLIAAAGRCRRGQQPGAARSPPGVGRSGRRNFLLGYA